MWKSIESNSMEDETIGIQEVEKCRYVELEERYNELVSEMQKRSKEFETLEIRFKELESHKLVVEEELRNLKESKSKLVSENVVDLDRLEDDDPIFVQMMVNKALEIEIQVAEKDAETWKEKFEKMVEVIRKLEEKGALRDAEWESDESVKLGLELAGIKFPERSIGKKTEACIVVEEQVLSDEGLAYHQSSRLPYVTPPVKDYASVRSRNKVSSSCIRVNKILSFEDDETILVTSDDEKESDVLEKRSNGEKYEDEDVEVCEANTSTRTTPRKRKRVITSDSENDDEDDIPICVLKGLKPENQENSELNSFHMVGTRSGLRKQRVLEECFTSSEKIRPERLTGISTAPNAEDIESEEESELESDSDSLNKFIVCDSHEISSNESDDIESFAQEESDGDTNFADIISRLRRDKNSRNSKWEYEADMLADFGKDPELCMRAVCVLYRLQTEEEKTSRSSQYLNGRGFSKFDAERGSRLGEFLTDGDPKNDLMKSVEELQNLDLEAVEKCRDLAVRYSKQLFRIYNNREDPYFALP